MTEPIVKWAGGKRSMLNRVVPLILERLSSGGRYVEPFLGGAAVALSLDAPTIASDTCLPLVETYAVCSQRPSRVHRRLRELAGEHCEQRYYEIRRWSPDNPTERAARFIYLNKAGFNGLYRVNRSGEFNVPFARRKRGGLSIPTLDHLRSVAKRMADWCLVHSDFEPVVELAREGDVVYADPPYDGTFDYSSDFGADAQARLAACLRRAARRGVGVVTTNADTPMVRRLYSWACVVSGSERRCVAADGDRRGDAECVVAMRP